MREMKRRLEIPVEQYDEFKKTLDAFGVLQNTLILHEKAR